MTLNEIFSSNPAPTPTPASPSTSGAISTIKISPDADLIQEDGPLGMADEEIVLRQLAEKEKEAHEGALVELEDSIQEGENQIRENIKKAMESSKPGTGGEGNAWMKMMNRESLSARVIGVY